MSASKELIREYQAVIDARKELATKYDETALSFKALATALRDLSKTEKGLLDVAACNTLLNQPEPKARPARGPAFHPSKATLKKATPLPETTCLSAKPPSAPGWTAPVSGGTLASKIQRVLLDHQGQKLTLLEIAPLFHPAHKKNTISGELSQGRKDGKWQGETGPDKCTLYFI